MKQKHQKAFSLLEVIISLFVLSVGFLGVINLAVTTLKNSMRSRDAVTATLLVQEGMELVYNVRDTNLAMRASDAFDGINLDSEGQIDALSPSIVPFAEGVLYRNSSGYYTHTSSGGTPTKFRRKIVIGGAADTREVTSIVVWGSDPFPSPPVSAANCSLVRRCDFARAVLQRND